MAGARVVLANLGGDSPEVKNKDRRAVEACQNMDFRYPEVTGWIRANKNDLKLVKSMGLKETGMLTSVSDYHIHLKLGKDRAAAMADYLEVAPSSEDHVDRVKVRDRVAGRDLVVVIASYTGHDLTNLVRDL